MKYTFGRGADLVSYWGIKKAPRWKKESWGVGRPGRKEICLRQIKPTYTAATAPPLIYLNILSTKSLVDTDIIIVGGGISGSGATGGIGSKTEEAFGCIFSNILIPPGKLTCW